MKYPLKQGLSWCMLSMAVSAVAQVSAPVASTQLPTGGKVMSGTTSIQSVGNVLNINQSSQRSAINWNTFNVGSGAKVNFIQPSASSVTLNRVLDTNGSQILGSISANGQVFISNPNGVLFGPNSQVNVGGLIATTQNISVDDFMAGKSTFEGTGAAGAVVNQGTLEAALGGYIALLAPSVRNEGVVLAREGTVAFAAGDKTVVQFNGPQLVTVMVDRPVLDALVENKQMVRADGGLVIFSARSANAVLSSVIRNTGTVQAQTIENKNGRILLIGDMQNGSVTVDGKLDASAPTQGDGGFIETSAAQVKIADSAVVTTLAKNGKTGTWLVDPHDYTVAASGGDQTGTQLSNSLGTTNVTLQSASGGQTVSGNININDGVSWNANTTLTLTATNNVNINANITASGTNTGLAINPNTSNLAESATGGRLNIGGGISIKLPNVSSSASSNSLVISGAPYSVINNINDLQGINTNLNGKYALGSDIEASSTLGWNSGIGFIPIGGSPTVGYGSRPIGFGGELTGLGNTINNLTINYGSNYNYVGLFSVLTNTSAVNYLNISNANVTSSGRMGILAGINGGTIKNVSTSGVVNALTASSSGNGWNIGGLVGVNDGASFIYNSSSSATVSGIYQNIGGLVGINSGLIDKSFSTGTLNANYGNPSPSTISSKIGGLVGENFAGIVKSSHSTGQINIYGTGNSVGGLIGNATLNPAVPTSESNITNSYSTSNINAAGNLRFAGGFVGNADAATIINTYAKGNITAPNGSELLGGFVGNAYSSATSIINSYSTGSPPAGSGINVAGFAGGLQNGPAIVNSFWNKEPTANSVGALTYISNNLPATAGLTGKTTSEMQSLAGSLNNSSPPVWTTLSNQNSGYPVLLDNVLFVRANSGLSAYGSTSVTHSFASAAGDIVGAIQTNGQPQWNVVKNGVSTGLNYLPPKADVGQYDITYTTGLTSVNRFYFFAPGASNTWTISPAILNVTATPVTKTYNGTLSAPTTALIGSIASGDLVNSPGSQSFLDKNTGLNKTVRATGVTIKDSSGVDMSSNYDIRYIDNTTSTITAAELTITASQATKIYDGTNSASGLPIIGALAGTASGDSISNYGRQAYLDSNIGIFNKAIRASGVSIKDSSGTDITNNYSIKYNDNSNSSIYPLALAGSQSVSSINSSNVVIPPTPLQSFSNSVNGVVPSQAPATAPVIAFTLRNAGDKYDAGAPSAITPNSTSINAPTSTSTNNPNIAAQIGTTTPQLNSVQNVASANTSNSPTTSRLPSNSAIDPNYINPSSNSNVILNAQRLADILSKRDPIEIATVIPPTQIAQLSPEQVLPLVNSLNLRQLMSLTNEQIAKFDPVRQAELLNIIKVIKDNPEKAAEKAFTPTDKTFAQLAANGLLKEQIDGLSTRVTQINQNKTNVNIDTPQKLAELLTKKDPVEIATALPSNQVAQLTPEQAAPLISSLTVRQLLALTNEQISKFEPARQTELLNIINVIKNNPEKAADKAYTAIDKTTAQYVANGLMKEQIDALASKVTQISQNKTTINLDGPQKLADILNNNTPVEVAKTLPSNLVPQLSSDQVAPLINAMSVKQLLSLTNEQMSKLDPARLTDLLNILKGLKDNPEKAIDKTYTPEDTAVAKYAATGLLKDPIERLAMRANYIADNKFKDPLSKELADLTNPPVPTNTPVARNTPNQANRPLTAAQLAAQNANSETPNLTPAQVAALDPKELGPLLSKLNANQLMGITNAQMAGLEGAYLNQLTVLLNFVQDKVANPIANAGPIAPGNRVNNTNIFINQPVAKLAGAALLADQPNTASPTAPVPTPSTQLASVTLTPKQVSELDPAQLAPLINQLNANQLMAITNAQMARMDGRALNQLTILMNFVQQRAANNNGPANGNNPAGTNTNINVFVNQPVSRLASNALLNEQPKPNATAGGQNLTQTNITVNLTPKQVSELDPTQLAPLISQLNANQLMAITNTQMARLDTQSINQLNILMNFVQQRALNSNTSTTIYINQPVSRIAAESLMNDQPLPSQVAGAAPAPIATVPLSPQQIANLTPNQVAPLLNRMNSRQLMAVTDTQMASLDSANLNQLITLLNFIQDSARTSPIVTNNFATRPVASFLPPELNTTQTVTQP